MGRKLTNFERWKATVPARTRELANLVEECLVTRCENAGFNRVYCWLRDSEDRIRGDEIQFERHDDQYVDVIYVTFAKYGAPRFQLGFMRRAASPPHAIERSGKLVARAAEYLHFWGKPWWQPSWAWATQDAERAVRGVAAKLDQIFAFLENDIVGRNISRQDSVKRHAAP